LCFSLILQGATGLEAPQLAAFDDFVNGLLAKWQIPGAALGVSHNGRLTLARGYGLADVEAGQPVQPDSLFRIGGLSKTVTAAAILRLAEDRKLSLDDQAFEIASIRELLESANWRACPAPPSARLEPDSCRTRGATGYPVRQQRAGERAQARAGLRAAFSRPNQTLACGCRGRPHHPQAPTRR